MKEEFEPIVCEVFDVKAQQSEIDRVNDLVAEGAFGRAAAKKFKVLKGIEVGLYEDSRELNKNILAAQNFDQVIASVHYLEDTDPYFGPYYKGKNWKEAYGRYLETLLREMRKLEDFDIMGHFDYIVRYAPYPKESIQYRDFPGLIDEILKYLIENGKGLEINTKTYRQYGLRTPELDRDILIRYMELGGDIICLGSDSHKADQVGARFDYFAQYVKMFGFRRLGHFENRRQKMVTI
jgi:histidinol-phosphatase (PHP family)